MSRRNTEIALAARRGPRRATTALVAGIMLVLPVAACSAPDGADAAAPPEDSTSVTASPGTTPASSSTAESSPTAAEDAESTTSSTPGPTSADGPEAVALDHLRALAAGDADAAWKDLGTTAQQTWPDRSAFDEQVAQQAQDYAAMLDSDPVVTTVEVTDLSVTTVAGVLDPAGSPRVTAYTVVTSRAGVLSSAPDALPSLEWLNPTSEDGGSLGIADHDPSAPVTVQLGPGATTFGFVVDGERLEAEPQVEQNPDAGDVVSIEAPALSSGQHVVTAVYGYPGEVAGARALVVEVR